MIIILTQCYPPRVGGIESVMHTLSDSLNSRNEEVLVITDSKNDEKEKLFDSNQPYPIIRCKGPKFLRALTKRKILRTQFKKCAPTALFTDSWKSLESISAVVRKNPVTSLCFAHGNEVLPRPKSRIKEWRIHRTFRQAFRIIAVSKATAKLVEYYAPEAGKCVVIYNPVPKPNSSQPDIPNQPDPCVEPLLASGHPRLLTVARLEPRKGHDQIIKNLPHLIKEFPDISYWIVGAGIDQSRLKALANELDVERRVIFLGRVDDATKHLLLKEADLMVMPTRHEKKQHSIEGFGLTYVEAAYHKLPVLAGRCGGAAEAVIDGKTGVLCNGDDLKSVRKSLHYCLTHVSLMKSYANAAYHRTTEIHDPKYVSGLYQSLWEAADSQTAPPNDPPQP